MRTGTRLTDGELDQVAGGVGGYGNLNNRYSYKVINSMGGLSEKAQITGPRSLVWFPVIKSLSIAAFLSEAQMG